MSDKLKVRKSGAVLLLVGVVLFAMGCASPERTPRTYSPIVPENPHTNLPDY